MPLGQKIIISSDIFDPDFSFFFFSFVINTGWNFEFEERATFLWSFPPIDFLRERGSLPLRNLEQR